MRVFKNKAFYRWAEDMDLPDEALKNAIEEIQTGSFDANLGGHIYKKRIAIAGRGKSSGVRTVIAFKLGKTAFFIYGFAKNVRANITEKEELALKKLVKIYFSYSDKQIATAVKAGEIFEVI